MVLFGPDFSDNQSGIVIPESDWNSYAFVTARAVHENGAKDSLYDWARDNSVNRKIPFDAYGFISRDPIAQADAACKAVGDTRIPIMADCEFKPYTWDKIVAWINRVRSNGFLMRRIYFGYSYWQYLGSPSLRGIEADVIVARYPEHSPTAKREMLAWYNHVNALYGAQTWGWNFGGETAAFWQYSSRVRVGNMYMDMNAYQGLASTLANWFYVVNAPPIPVPPPVGPIVQSKSFFPFS